MPISPLAGKPAPRDMLIDVAALVREYHERTPDLSDPTQLVAFGTSGHRGTPLRGTFTEAHIRAITQAICDYRRDRLYTGPVFMGKDTHALSGPAQNTAIEVLAANGVETIIQPDDGVTPTPVISRAIIVYNNGRTQNLADGIIITPSHNPPEDGGFKYNPPQGGPADTDVTSWIQRRANDLLKTNNAEVKRMPLAAALRATTTHEQDYVRAYVEDLRNVVDMDAIRSAGLKLGVDPLGGAAVHYWEPIVELYGLDITVVNKVVDPQFGFMTVDHDGQIRMDCSSPYAMARLVGLKDKFRVAFANDPDSDRHGIVTPGGLDEPEPFFGRRDSLSADAPAELADTSGGRQDAGQQQHDRPRGEPARPQVVGSAGRIQMVCSGAVRQIVLLRWRGDAGASFCAATARFGRPTKTGRSWTCWPPKSRPLPAKTPASIIEELTAQFGTSYYTRIDAAATPEQKSRLLKLSPEAVKASTMAGEPIVAKLTRAPATTPRSAD